MCVVKKLSMIFLAIYLVLSGLFGMTGNMPSDIVMYLMKGSGILSGILMLIAIEHMCSSCGEVHDNQ